MKKKYFGFAVASFSVLFLILFLSGHVISEGFAGDNPNEDDLQQKIKQKPRPKLYTRTVVQSVTRDHVSLTRGSSKTITLKGRDLNAITSVQVLRKDDSKGLITAEILSPRTNSELKISLKASPYALVESEYKLKLIAGQMTISIPNNDVPFSLAVVIPAKAKPAGKELDARKFDISKKKQVSFKPDRINYTPPHTLGGRDFSGNGPDIRIAVNMQIPSTTKDRIICQIYMHAIETEPDWTTASSSDIYVMYVAPPGKEIVGIEEGYRIDWEGTDHHHQPETISAVYGLHKGPVKSLYIIGDIKGDDVENLSGGTHEVVEFKPLRIHLIDK